MHFAAHIAATLVAFSAFVLVLPLQAQSLAPGHRPGAQAGRDGGQGLPEDPQGQGRGPAHLRQPPGARTAPPGHGPAVAARQRGGLQRRQRHAHGRELLRSAGRQRPQHRHDRRPARLRAAGLQPAPGAARQPDRPARRPDAVDGGPDACASPSRSIPKTAARCCGRRADRARRRRERSQQAGEAIINRIFDSADKSAVGDAGCPL